MVWIQNNKTQDASLKRKSSQKDNMCEHLCADNLKNKRSEKRCTWMLLSSGHLLFLYRKCHLDLFKCAKHADRQQFVVENFIIEPSFKTGRHSAFRALCKMLVDTSKDYVTSNPGWILLRFSRVIYLLYISLFFVCFFTCATQPPSLTLHRTDATAAGISTALGALTAGSRVKTNSHRQPSDGVWSVWRPADTTHTISPTNHHEAFMNKTTGNRKHFQ